MEMRVPTETRFIQSTQSPGLARKITVSIVEDPSDPVNVSHTIDISKDDNVDEDDSINDEDDGLWMINRSSSIRTKRPASLLIPKATSSPTAIALPKWKGGSEPSTPLSLTAHSSGFRLTPSIERLPRSTSESSGESDLEGTPLMPSSSPYRKSSIAPVSGKVSRSRSISMRAPSVSMKAPSLISSYLSRSQSSLRGKSPVDSLRGKSPVDFDERAGPSGSSGSGSLRSVKSPTSPGRLQRQQNIGENE